MPFIIVGDPLDKSPWIKKVYGCVDLASQLSIAVIRLSSITLLITDISMRSSEYFLIVSLLMSTLVLLQVK